jgi:hypothetical protein
MNNEKLIELQKLIDQEIDFIGSYSDLLIKELKKPKQEEIKKTNKISFIYDENTRNIEVKFKFII